MTGTHVLQLTDHVSGLEGKKQPQTDINPAGLWSCFCNICFAHLCCRLSLSCREKGTSTHRSTPGETTTSQPLHTPPSYAPLSRLIQFSACDIIKNHAPSDKASHFYFPVKSSHLLSARLRTPKRWRPRFTHNVTESSSRRARKILSVVVWPS